MSIFNWFKKMLGIDEMKTIIDLPPEFQLSTENNKKINDSVHDFNDSFEENLNSLFTSSLEKLLSQMKFEFSSNNEDDSNIFIDDTFNQPSIGGEYHKIPKKNFEARKYFLNSSLEPKRTFSKSPVKVAISPGFNVGQANSRSFHSEIWNGRKIEKEISTRQLPDGVIQKIIIIRDGNQKLVTTTNHLSGLLLNSKRELYNLDESQLDEFENRFSKFK